ncbi:flagellar hook-associated protein FlgK [Anaeromicrobium sediminis]|uniref:Flagellar hook-associated protein 1 n=1 Tax=Anaeromicrobium sediminis TaxID=1478221 RepID=A0A267MMT2_9FIRM|nr:flagellar hook-associated protein FlgK [Anaeromicrobium sediminis]PAB60123.1 flagellar hook-associated protein FlgK [Anaeromicrobium sediminis]
MSSTMGSYMIPNSGLYTSQTSLYVTNNNISNVDTSGYTRQQAISCNRNPYSQGLYEIGSGVDIQQVRQMRNSFLDNSYREENSTLGYWETKSSVVNDIEPLLGAFSEYGLYSSMDNFFYSWDELSKNPESITERAAVIECGVAFADTVNQIDEQLTNIQQDVCTKIASTVDEINLIADGIAELNQKILDCETSGVDANDYRDQRNFLIDQLSYLTDMDISEQPNGMVNVTVGGVDLVNGNESKTMEVEISNPEGSQIEVKWQDSGKDVQIKDGKLKGLKDCIEGEDNIINKVRSDLDTLVNTMATEINAIHSTGYGLDGSTGIDFYVPIDPNKPIGMRNIQVNPVLDDPNKLAASASGEPGDNAIAKEIVDFRNKECFEFEGSNMNIDDYTTYVIASVGTAGKDTTSFAENQRAVVNQIQFQRQSISQVSMDEEMNNMIRYQQSYNANAKAFQAIDEMIDNIINKMGIG